jgi:hypothetical protein
MAALAADKLTRRRGAGIPTRRTYLMKASTTIYKGAIVALEAGLALPAADTAGFVVVGIATNGQVSAASGNFYVTVECFFEFLLDVGAGITQADVGAKAVVADDQTVTDAAAGTNDIVVGTIIEYLDETQDKAWVAVEGITR